MVLAVLVAGASWGPAAADDDAAHYSAFVDRSGPPLVTVKFTLKIKRGGSGESENESEIAGVLIDPKGLVLCSNTELSGGTATFARIMGASDIRATPTDVKLLIGDDEEGKDAEVLVRDTELDLAWVRLSAAPDKPLPYVDFTKSVVPEVGDVIFTTKRLGRFFGRSLIATQGRIGGRASKPRDLFLPAGDLEPELGLPVYTADGRVVGVTVVQVPDSSGDMDRLAVRRLLSSLQSMGGVILPADQVVKSTKRALTVADAEE